jgi:hypothetical protein
MESSASSALPNPIAAYPIIPFEQGSGAAADSGRFQDCCKGSSFILHPANSEELSDLIW